VFNSSIVLYDTAGAQAASNLTLTNYTTLQYSLSAEGNYSVLYYYCYVLGVCYTMNYTLTNDHTDPIITNGSFNRVPLYLFSNITQQINFSDDNLYRWNVTVDNVSIASAINVAYTSYIYNLSINPLNYKSGNHSVVLTVADGHTANEISNYQVTKGGWFDDKNLMVITYPIIIKYQMVILD
jgi:hypothetical protein